MRKYLWLWALAAIWSASLIASRSSASAEDNPRYREVTYYYVAGVTKGGPVRSELYRDQGQAARVMANWQREHAAGGLLEADPFVEGPAIRTETLRERISPPAPDRPAAPPPFEPQRPGDRPGETGGGTGSPTPDAASSTSGGPDLWKGLKEKQWVDVPDRITGNPNGPHPKTDKDQQFIGTFTGTEGGNSAVTFQFLANGDVIAKDKDGEWKGKWVSFGDNQIQIELLTPNGIEYEGKLENGKLTGWGRSRKSGRVWNLNVESLQVSTSDVNPVKASDVSDELKAARHEAIGTWVRYGSGAIGGHLSAEDNKSVYQFNADGTGTYSDGFSQRFLGQGKKRLKWAAERSEEGGLGEVGLRLHFEGQSSPSNVWPLRKLRAEYTKQ